jgi:hypothetical protein
MSFPYPMPDHPGDEVYEDLLAAYACPVSLRAVKFRFWGHITTTAMTVSPVQAMEYIWGGDLPEFQTLDEANDVFARIQVLWNVLVVMNMEGKRLRLSPRTGLAEIDGLRRMVEYRIEELDGFFDAFTGDLTIYDSLEPAVNKHLGKIASLLETLEWIRDELEQPDPPFKKLRASFIAQDAKSQKLLDSTVKAANAVRGVGSQQSADDY